MKKISTILLALALGTSLSGIAGAGINGMDGGCDKCDKVGAHAPADPFRKFQVDTIDLRQEMMIKRFEVQRENLKGAPDQARIAAFQADIKTLQSKILAIRSQSGLPVDKCDGECSQFMGGCDKKEMVGCNKAPGGCNGAPCGKK
ncbi:MAG TPA: hypothetical protein HPP94_12185 [Desulfuromonadales bacterium]|nr:hypothetical protein [Desulfuromonadales bacterium]